MKKQRVRVFFKKNKNIIKKSNKDRCKNCEFHVYDVDRTACIECVKDYLINRSGG
jgi:hypothetical protein